VPKRKLPSRPNLEQYKKQAKELMRDWELAVPDSIARFVRHHPRLDGETDPKVAKSRVSLTDAQLVIAREHGFENWARFAEHIQTLLLEGTVDSLEDPIASFIEAACVPRDAWHSSGTVEHAELILARYPHVAQANIYTAAILADEAGVRTFLSGDSKLATATGGPYGWDALTHLCFSRYLRIDRGRSQGFVRTAKALLEAGASANVGWYERSFQPGGEPEFESAIYGAAGIAHHPGLTQLLLDYGADPNDGETPYHVPESYDNTVMKILLDSNKLSERSVTWMLVRKADWHDLEGMRMTLQYGANPNAIPRWGNNALQHSVQRDNHLAMIELLLDHGADPALKNGRDGKTAVGMAVHRGRADVLSLLERRGLELGLSGADVLIAACAKGDEEAVTALKNQEPQPVDVVLSEGGTLLSQFAGNGNVDGVACLLALGVRADAVTSEGDPYFDIAKDSTALHAAAWRAWPSTVQLLIERGAPVNAKDGKGRSALMLAVKACVDSYWTNRRSPESVEALLKAGASLEGVDIPCGYEDVDRLLRTAAEQGRK
jgi:ankyrin repeat protein